MYGGWLCLAPEGTDFDNPMQRSRVSPGEILAHTPALLRFHAAAVITLFVVSGHQKWQRRFFILYEDGGLSFALDELVRSCKRAARGITPASLGQMSCAEPQQMIWA